MSIYIYVFIYFQILFADLTCTGLIAAFYINDTTLPRLERFAVDMNTGMLDLTFDETVDLSTFRTTQFTLVDAINSDITNYTIRLQGDIITRDDSYTISLFLNESDVNRIKFDEALFTTPGNSFITLTSNAVIDMSGNPAMARGVSMALQASEFSPDAESPILESFILDLNSNILTLTFNEPIAENQFNPRVITLLNDDGDNFTRMYSIEGVQNSVVRSDVGRIVQFSLSVRDQDELKAYKDFATDTSNTFMSVSNELTVDRTRMRNPNAAINTTFPLQASSVISDGVPPSLVSFSLFNLEEGFFRLLFNEPVNLSSIIYERISILALPSENQSLLPGEASYVGGSLRTEIQIQFSPEDLAYIKLNDNLGTQAANTMVQLQAGAIQDQSGNDIETSSIETIQPQFFVDDGVGPRPVSFILDLNKGTITISFDDIVRNEETPQNRNPIDISGISIQADSGGLLSNRIQLTQQPDNSDITNSTNGYVTLIFIPHNNLNELKAQSNLGTNVNNTFLTLSAITIQDVRGNPAEAVISRNALQASEVIPDTTPPRLDAFDLDLNGMGNLTLYFDETMSQINLDVTQISLVGTENESVSLTSINFSPNPPTASFFIILGETDLNRIKSLANLGSYMGNTRLAIAATAINDTSGNRITETVTMPLLVQTYDPDVTKPGLQDYSLDLNIGKLVLTFNETVNGSSFDPKQITIASTSIGTSLTHTLTGGDFYPVFHNVLRLNLSITDLNILKQVIGLADNSDTTFLSLTESTVRDMESNFVSRSIAEILSFQGRPLEADNYISDTTSPLLVSFSLNLTSERLILTFDETVNASSLMIDLIKIQSESLAATTSDAVSGNNPGSGSGNGSAESGSGSMVSGSGEDMSAERVFSFVMLTSGSENPSTFINQDSTEIIIILGSGDLNNLKLETDLATSINNTFISFPNATIADMNGNVVAPIPMIGSKQVEEFYNDFIAPMLVRFDLNLTSQTISLTFSEVVNASSLDVAQFTLLAGPDSSIRRQLINDAQVNGSTSSPADGTVLTIYLGVDDLNEIKRQANLGTSVSNSFLSFTSEAVRDMNGNALNPRLDSDPLPATLFSNDSIDPSLTAFNLDVNLGLLTLEFSETVNAGSLNVSGILLLSASQEEANQSLYLTSGSRSISMDGTRLVVNISRQDLNNIKYLIELARSDEDTYLSINSGAILDMNFNPVLEISEFNAYPVSTYIPDVVGPILESFQLNLTSEVLTLNFDETVNVSSLDFMSITLQSSLDSPLTHYDLTGGEILHDNSPMVHIQLDYHDLNQIKLDTDLATGSSNTVINLSDDAVNDLALIANPSFASVLALDVANYYPDTIGPMLLDFSVDLNSEILTLNFDEPVNASSLDATGITFLDGVNGLQYRLTGGNTSSMNGLQISVLLDRRDLNNLKRMESFLVSAESSFISISPTVIRDMSGNQVMIIPPERAINASFHTNDTTQPYLVAYDLDLNSNILTLQFFETVDIASINFDGLTLQQASNTTNQYTLTDGTILTTEDSTVVEFRLVTRDLNAIKSQQIALTQGTTWLTMDESFILDQNMQPVQPIINGVNALPVRTYANDITPPMLDMFILDLNSSTLTLYFSETVNVIDTFMLNGLILLSEPDNSFQSNPVIHMFGSDPQTRTTDIYEPIIVVSLGRLDLNQIKELTALATNENNTFLTVDSITVQDMRENSIVPIVRTNPQAVFRYIEDRIPPELEVFDLNMDAEMLTLYFSESVNHSTLDISQLTLQYSANGVPSAYSYALSGGQIQPGFRPNITLELTTYDLNEIKRISQLATAREDTFISVGRGAIQDMNNNFIKLIPSDVGIQVTDYVSDITDPNLVSFELDLSSERLILTFDETVNSSSLSVSSITLQNLPLGVPPDVRVLVGGTVLTPDDPVVIIQLDSDDLNYIKSIQTLATSAENTYLRLDSLAIDDMAGNNVTELINGRAIEAKLFRPDDKAPVLVSFNIDVDMGTLELTFNETVSVASLSVNDIILKPEEDSLDVFSFNASSGTMSRSLDQPVVLIEIGNDDLNEIKFRLNLATNENNTYIELNSLSINDTNQNRVTPDTLQVTDFEGDITSPTLSSFAFDLDEGRLHLTFSETVLYETLDVTQITLQAEEVLTGSVSNLRISNGTVLTLRNGVSLSFELVKDDLDALKAIRDLASSQYSTYITLSEESVTDTSGNELIAVNASNSTMAAQFVPDTTNPELEYFELDMNTGILVMTFSETVDAPTLMFVYLTLQDGASASSTYKFRNSTWSMELNPVVYINISKADLDLLKENRQVARSRNTTYISLTNLTILDTSGNGVVPIDDGMAQRARVFVRDRTSPVLEAFDLDIDSGLLTLFYSETVDIFSLDPTKIVLQNDANFDTTSFALTGGEVTLVDGTISYVLITVDDLNEIKRLEDLATCRESDTFLSLVLNQTLSSSSSQFSGSGSGNGNGSVVESFVPISYHILDMAGNPVIAIESDMALPVMSSGCIQDTTSPRLTNFSINMYNGTLTLTFDETVNSSTLDLNEVTFFNGQNDSNQSYRLQSGYADNDNLTGQLIIEVTLSNVDLNELKRREYLATEASNTFILITEYLVLDMNGNRNQEITFDNSSEAMTFVADTKAPELLSFNLDLTREWLTLSFSETVNATSFNVRGITLQNRNFTSLRNLMEGYVLNPAEGGSPLGPNDPVLIVRLGQDDLNYIKIFEDLATDITDTFIAIESNTVSDMNYNMVQEVSMSDPLNVQMFNEDRVDPYLVRFDLDIDSGELTLIFSETVDVSSLDVSQITLQNDVASSVEDRLSFTPGNTSFETFSTSSDGPIVLVEIGSIDLNEIKRLTQLATSNDTTYITLSDTAINDTNGNPVVPINNGNGTQVTLFTPDTTDPQLTSFSLDLNSGSLQLTFNETVRFSSLNITTITLQNSSILTESSVMLTIGNITNLYDSTVVEVLLSIEDQNEIKRIRSLGTSMSNTYLSLLSGGIEDMNGNGVVEVSSLDALLVEMLEEDEVDPTLLSFDLDMDAGVIELTFDETVEADSLNLEEITVQNNRPFTDNNFYALTGGASSDVDSTVLVINISVFDLNEIKKIRGLASVVDGNNTYISITNITVFDMNNNPVNPVPNEVAIRVDEFTEDITPPVLYAFDLDMNLGLLALNFSETVDALTFNIIQYVLQSAQNVSEGLTQSYTLTEENLLTGDGIDIVQALLYFDLNSIKSLSGLATNMSDTFLSFTDMAIRDMNGNLVMAISENDALQVSDYVVDIRRPVLESFDLDMNTGQITLTFSETVDVSSLDVMEMQLVNHASDPSSSFRFTANTNSMSSNWPIFVVNISTEDLNVIKSMLSLAVSNDTTFVVLSEFFIYDAAGNMNVEVNGSQVRFFTPDVTRPRLVSFNLDLTLDVLTLTFDETVMGATLRPEQLTLVSGFQNDGSTSGSGSGSGSSNASDVFEGVFVSYTLTGGANLPINLESTEMRINLTFTDRNEIKRLYNLATSFHNTFLSITPDFIEDTNMNDIVEINISEPLQVTYFNPDITPPELLYFNLDMDSRNLTLYFSETVNVDSLNVTQIVLQGSSDRFDGSVEYYRLTNMPALYGSYSNSPNSSVVIIEIGENDSNMIKVRTELAVNTNTTYISFLSGTITDMNDVPVAMVPDSNAARVRSYYRDATPPLLREFSLNLTSEILSISFDESVDLLSIQALDISLYSSSSINSTFYTFRAVFPIGTNSPLVVLNLTESQRDLDAIKLLSDLATEKNNTFLSLDEGAITDLSIPPNPIQPVVRQVFEYFPDATSPEIVEFYVNVDSGMIMLVFNEVVNASSFNPQAIRLQNSSMVTSSFVDLTGESNWFVECIIYQGTQVILQVYICWGLVVDDIRLVVFWYKQKCLWDVNVYSGTSEKGTLWDQYKFE